ncbi:MAG TPA: metallophosphoesterase [Calditerricola sp.]
MRYVEANLPETLSYVDLWAVSDIHRGHRLHDEKAWHALLDRIANDPHAYMVLNGDLVEAALKSSRHGDVYRSMAPGEERRLLVRELEPVKHKILCITSGNHELRHRDSDENPAALIAERLGLEDRYHPDGVLLEVSFGRKHGTKGVPTSFLFYVTHGRGMGRLPGGNLNRIFELPRVVQAVDGYIMGHVHKPIIFVSRTNIPDPRNKTCSPRLQLYAIAGSFLEWGDYAEQNMLAPTVTAFPVARLFQKEKWHPCKLMGTMMGHIYSDGRKAVVVLTEVPNHGLDGVRGGASSGDRRRGGAGEADRAAS